MTQEEKELLLKDLCARLPYGVIIGYNNDGCSSTKELGLGSLHDFMFDNAELKPYLRPMSSMTEEERKEYTSLCNRQDIDTPTWSKIIWHDTYKSIDWLNKKMFDYRNLIPKGLAIEALEGMYNLK